jgi:hypothetical protein
MYLGGYPKEAAHSFGEQVDVVFLVVELVIKLSVGNNT